MKRKIRLSCVMILFAHLVSAQTPAEKNGAYIRTITGRAEKIVASLHLGDSARYKNARETLVLQYQNLNAIYADRDLKLKKGNDPAQREAYKKEIESEFSGKLTVLHDSFLSRLAKDLDDAQIVEVKNGLTYNVLPVTYQAYQDMIPSLTEPEKQQILSWLTEARELAMDGGSSEDKHRIFGKYKGRINNYLSSAGYDLQKERKAWEERLKMAESR